VSGAQKRQPLQGLLQGCLDFDLRSAETFERPPAEPYRDAAQNQYEDTAFRRRLNHAFPKGNMPAARAVTVSRVLDKVHKLRQGNADHTADDAGEDEGYPKFVRMFHGDFVFETGFGSFVKKSNGLNI